ncbi:hypothetical protein VQL36_11610 [Chengkuizengella sp. SCS-71B]|uniref:hypothetical protein n=1 Tax=Chengkuizengella sp. SCS-71B TaxID=3115290 RepID=UPI0032C24426
MGKWVYIKKNADKKWDHIYNTKEGAIKAGRQFYKNSKQSFQIGELSEVYICVNGDQVIDQVCNDVSEQSNYFSREWIQYIDDCQMSDLNTLLTKVFNKWLHDTFKGIDEDEKPSFNNLERIETISF